MDDIECSFEVVGDCGEVDLDGGFGDPAPSHPAKPIASFPGPEYLLDAAPHPMDRLVPFFELTKRLVFVAAPHAGGDDARRPAFGTNSITEVVAAIGTVGKNIAGIIGQRIGASSAVIDISGCDGDLLDQRSVGIGTDMSLETVNSGLALVFDPARVIIALAGRCNDRGIDQCAGLDHDRFDLELRRYGREQQPVQVAGHQRLAEAHKGRPLRRRFSS